MRNRIFIVGLRTKVLNPLRLQTVDDLAYWGGTDQESRGTQLGSLLVALVPKNPQIVV